MNRHWSAGRLLSGASPRVPRLEAPRRVGLLPATDLLPLDKVLPWALDGEGGGGDVHADHRAVDDPIRLASPREATGSPPMDSSHGVWTNRRYS